MFEPKPLVPNRKKFFIAGGIIAFVVLLLIFYVANLKNVFEFNAQKQNSRESFDWSKIKNDFDKTIAEVNQTFKAAKNQSIAQASGALVNKMVSNINDSVVPSNQTASSSAVLSASSSTVTLDLLEEKLNLDKNNPRK